MLRHLPWHDPAPRGFFRPAARTIDTVSAYPHRAVLALVNWPIGVAPANPGTLLPRVHAAATSWPGTGGRKVSDALLNLD